MSEDAFFADDDGTARGIWTALCDALLATGTELGQVTRRVSKSQIGLWRAHPFAAVWRPGPLLGPKRAHPAAPLVLSVFARHPIRFDRWKEVVEPAPGRFTHHLELFSPADVDADVLRVLAEAARDAGPDRIRKETGRIKKES